MNEDSVLEGARSRWIDKNLVLARGSSGTALGGSGTLLEASRMLWDALEASGTLQDDLRGLKHYACSGCSAP